MSVVEFVY